MKHPRTRNLLLTLLGIAFTLFVIVILVITFHLGALIKTAVVKVGPTFTGGPIQLDAITIRPLGGKAIVKGLVIGNPEGFQTPSAFELAELRVDLNLLSIFSGKLVIHEVIIDGPRITYEKSKRKSNIDTIMANVEKRSLARKPTPKPTPAPEPRPPKSDKDKPPKPEQLVEIDRLVIRNGLVNYSSGSPNGNAVPLPLPTITLTDIGKDEDMTMPQTIAHVTGEIINGVGTALVQSFRRAGRGLQKSGERLAELAQDNKDVADDAAAGIGRAADDVRGVAHEGLKRLGLGELIGKPQEKED